MTEDDTAVDTRADEDAREQRWADFVVWLRKQDQIRRRGFSDVLSDISDLYSDLQRGFSRHDFDLETLEDSGPILNFQETEGWSGVFAALARAIAEQEAACP